VVQVTEGTFTLRSSANNTVYKLERYSGSLDGVDHLIPGGRMLVKAQCAKAPNRQF